jgi:hypothetical protein
MGTGGGTVATAASSLWEPGMRREAWRDRVRLGWAVSDKLSETGGEVGGLARSGTDGTMSLFPS